MSHETAVQRLTAILRAENESRPVFLLGAGASFSSQIPMAEECVKRLVRRVYAERELGGRVLPHQVRQAEWQRWLASQPWFVPGPDRLAENFPLVVEHLLQPSEYRRRNLLDLMQIGPGGVGGGYKALADLVLKGLVKTILTTNFDACLPTALGAVRAHLPYIAEVNRTPDDLREFNIYARAQLVWVHGRLESYADKNLVDETATLDPDLRGLLLPLLRDSPLVVIGYRGAEDSITRDLLIRGAAGAIGYPRGIYWCTRTGEELHSNVRDLAAAIGRNFQHLEIKGFDELLQNLREALRDEDLYTARTSASRPGHDDPFVDRPAADATLDDVDLDLALATFHEYCATLGRRPVARETLLPLLRELRLTVQDGPMERPTNGCLLLFGRDQSSRFPYAVVTASVGERKRTVVEGNLLTQRRNLLTWLQAEEVNPTLKVKRVAIHEEEQAFQPRALVELLVNLLVHRDYEVAEPSTINVQPSRGVEFRNPGGLAPELRDKVVMDDDGTISHLPAGFTRNRVLCDVFAGIRFMEWRGTGLPDVVRLTKAAGGRASFAIDERDGFLATMTRRPSAAGVARDDRPTGTYVLNSMPIVALPEEVSIVELKGELSEKLAPALSEAGTFVRTRDDALWSFTPLPLLKAALHPLGSGARVERRAEIEASVDKRRVLSWLIRRHFEVYLGTFADAGLVLEPGGGRRAFFTGVEGKPRTVIYNSQFRRNVRREVVKQRAEGDRGWFENEGFGYEVKPLGDLWAIRIKPFYMFTGVDAATPLPSFARTARATRRMKFDRNPNVDSDLGFWARFLSRGGSTINIGQSGTADLLVDGAFLVLEVPDLASDGDAV